MKNRRQPLLLIFFSFALNACTEEVATPAIDCNEAPIAVEIVHKEDTECSASEGLVEVEASGGTGNYEYKIGTRSFQESPLFTDLPGGTYTVTVRDENCEENILVAINNINGMNVAVVATESGCENDLGFITIEAENGTPPYLFKIDQNDFQEENIFDELAQGNYTIVAKDATGCEVSQAVTVNSGISYTNTVATIIATNCAVSGCHSGTQAPDFREFGNIKQNASSIKSQVASRNMPKDGTLSQQQINAIVCWVDDGAPQN